MDDTSVESYEKPMLSSTTAWTSMAEDSSLHDIHAILKRPVQVHTGEFDSSFTSVNLKFPDVILQKSTNVVKKLDYFTYFRANVKVKIMFNATPFMSGKYWLYFAPFDSISNRGSLVGNLPNNTGFPGIEIDLATNAPVEIKMPYCAPLSHYNLLDTHSNMGELKLIPLNPIRSGENPVANGAGFTIFAWFEDIELAMPTSLPITVPTFKAQVGSEEVAATSGPTISGASAAVASASSTLSGAIPILGKFLRPVEWVSRFLSGAASAAGWNKPGNLDKNSPYVNVPAKGYTQADGIDLSAKLCAMPDNGLTYESGLFSTDVDEMDLSFVAAKSCIFRSEVLWSTDETAATQLLGFHVAPGLCQSLSGSLKATTVAFLTSMFRYWRGSMKYRLTVAKTAFHTGRLRITYHPGVYNVLAANRVNENAYNWILDLSVSSELEFEVPYVANVPWKETLIGDVFDVNFAKEKFSTGTVTVEVLTPLRASSTSVSTICPINVWIAGGDDISFAVPDFGNCAIADPDNPGTFNESTVSSFTAQVFNETSPAVAHNEQTGGSCQTLFPKNSMGPTTSEELTIGEKITSLRQLIKRFGITTTGSPYPYTNEIGGAACPFPIPLNNDDYLVNQVVLDPAYFGEKDILATKNLTKQLPFMRAPGGAINTDNVIIGKNYGPHCPLYYISYLYKFYRGGRRYKVVAPPGSDYSVQSTGWRPTSTAASDRSTYTNTMDNLTVLPGRSSRPLFAHKEWQIKENGDISAPLISTFTTRDTFTPFEHYVYPDLCGTLEFEAPYYAQTPISLVGEKNISDDEGPLIRRSRLILRRSQDPRGLDTHTTEFFSNTSYPSMTDEGIRGAFGEFVLYEAAADDFSFGYLVGAPLLKRLVAIP